jgi:hypothetical protein
MSIWDTFSRVAETAEEQVQSFSDPDGYYFPKIDESLRSGDPNNARRLLETWRGKKILKYKQEGKSTGEIAAIQDQYNAKLQQISGVPGGGPLGLDRSVVITALIAGGVLFFVYKAYKKGN